LFAQLVSKIFNLRGHDPPTSQTDRRTDRQTDRETTCYSKTALCTIVHRAVKQHKFATMFQSACRPNSDSRHDELKSEFLSKFNT